MKHKKPARLKRRLEREKELGPERRIILRTEEVAVLECGHRIFDPPVSQTVHMREPKYYRCIHCKDNHEIVAEGRVQSSING